MLLRVSPWDGFARQSRLPIVRATFATATALVGSSYREVPSDLNHPLNHSGSRRGLRRPQGWPSFSCVLGVVSSARVSAVPKSLTAAKTHCESVHWWFPLVRAEVRSTGSRRAKQLS